jgi:hypothetical protein
MARKAAKRLMDRLRKTDLSVDDLALAIRSYLNDRFKLSMASLTTDEAQAVLTSNGISVHSARKFGIIFSRIEKAVYTGGLQKSDDIREEMLHLIQEIEKEIP